MGVAVSKDQYKRACSVDLYEFGNEGNYIAEALRWTI